MTHQLLNWIDPNKLTNQQKLKLKNMYQNIADIENNDFQRNETIRKMTLKFQ